jgi:hypothetical protein
MIVRPSCDAIAIGASMFAGAALSLNALGGGGRSCANKLSPRFA